MAPLPAFPWRITGLTCIGAFIGQVDASIVQLALPRLARVFLTPLDTVSWVSLAYLLAFAACLPVFGRLCQMHGRKRVYLLGYALFTTASALCAMAPGIGWLIALRALQGIGGAMLGANSVALLVAAVAGGQRGRALGFFAAAQAVGISLGPAAGGLLLHFFGWRAIFWATVPFGLLGAGLGWAALPRDQPGPHAQRFDWTGALLLMPALILIVLTLNETARWGLLVLPAFGLGGVLLALFARRERRAPAPLVSPALLASGRFACGGAAVLIGYALLYGMFFVLSFALVRGYHEDEALAGLRMAIVPVMIGITAPFSGGFAARHGTGRVTIVAMALCGVAILLLALIARERVIPAFQGMAMLALFGAGLGLFIGPSNNAAIAVAPQGLGQDAGALVNLLRVLGTSIGVASASATLSWSTAAVTHTSHGLFLFTGHPILSAVEANFAMLFAFVLLAVAACLLRDRPRRAGIVRASSPP